MRANLNNKKINGIRGVQDVHETNISAGKQTERRSLSWRLDVGPKQDYKGAIIEE